jgi:hypothetical protein
VIKFPRPRPFPFPKSAPLAALAFAAALALSFAPSFATQSARPSAAPENPPALPSGGPSGSPSGNPPTAAAFGLIWLEVDPGPAEVSLDGDFLDAGVWLISVSPGEHEVRVRKTGFRAYAGRVSVPPGGSVHLDVRLQPGAAGDS